MHILDRATYLEWIQVLFVGTALIAGIFLGTVEFRNLIDLTAQAGIPLSTAMTITALQLPSSVVFCLPAGVLMATMLVLWRRSVDSEIVAMRIAGTSFSRLLRPFFVLGVATMLLSFILTEYVIPTARKTANKLLVVGVYNGNLPVTNKSFTGIDFGADAKLRRILLVGTYLEKSLKDVVILDFREQGAVKLIFSEAGIWKCGSWRLHQGHIYKLSSKLSASDSLSYQSMVIPGMTRMSVDDDSKSLLPTEHSTAELGKYIDELRHHNKPVDPSKLLRFYRRFSQPISCVLLVLAAIPLGLLPRRSRAAGGLVMAGAIVILYFLLQELSFSLGDNQRLDPLLAAWLPGGTLAIFGLIFLAHRIMGREI